MELVLLGLILLFIVVLVGLIVRLYIIYTHMREFPTSPYVPILGHVFDYSDPSKILDRITQNVINYGGILRQFIGPRKPSLLTASKDFVQFLCYNKKHVRKSKFYKFLKPWLGEGLITSDGLKWKSRRKALSASLTQTSVLKSFVEVFERNGDILVSTLNKLEGENVNLHVIMKQHTLRVIFETALGISLDNEVVPSYRTTIETLCEVIQNRMLHFLKNFDFFYQFTEDCKREKAALAEIERILDKIISKKLKEKHKNRNGCKRKDILDLMMETEINGRSLSRSDLREEINTITFAGYDTSSTAISLVLYEAARHPDIQQKLLNEQAEIFKEDFHCPEVTYEKLQEMEYLSMVIKETLRLHTIVPSVGKTVTKNLTYDNKLVPSMVNVNVFLHGIHHNPQYFPEPDKFDPERFAPKNKIDEYTYLPFGLQPRQCLGRQFAMLEIESAVSKIVRNFEIIRIPEHQLKLQPKLVLFSTNGICVKLKRRSEKPTL